jgi:hypothetical protein
MMEGSERTEDRQAAARRTVTALLIVVFALFVGSTFFMVTRDSVAPDGRRVLAILPFQGPSSGAGNSFSGADTAPAEAGNPYSGFAEGLTAYFSRADPNDLGVFGPASTSQSAESLDDPLAVARVFDADMVLVGREVSGDPPMLVTELLRVDDGTTLWRGDYEVGPYVDRRALLVLVSTEVTQMLDLPR